MNFYINGAVDIIGLLGESWDSQKTNALCWGKVGDSGLPMETNDELVSRLDLRVRQESIQRKTRERVL